MRTDGGENDGDIKFMVKKIVCLPNERWDGCQTVARLATEEKRTREKEGDDWGYMAKRARRRRW
jgi:hypothetical protein